MSNNIPAAGTNAFLYSLRLQVRVVRALLIRELLTRYGRNNLGFLWLFLEPMLFTLIITGVWTATRSVHGSDLPIVAFAITGYASLMMWRNMPGRCINALSSNRSLLFHRQVRPIDVYLARVLLEFAGSTIAFVVLVIGFASIEWLALPEDALQILGGWLMLGWFGMSLAILLGALSEQTDLVEKLWSPLSYLLIPFSGAAFILDSIPEQARDILLYLPMINCVEFLREGYFGSAFTAHYDMGYVSVFNLVLTFFALIRIRLVTVSTDFS